MGKIKVYELSKELNIPSKEIASFLQENGIEGKVAQSALEDSAAELVRKKFGTVKEEPKADAPVAQPKKETPAEAVKEAAPEVVKKKKRIPRSIKRAMSS